MMLRRCLGGGWVHDRDATSKQLAASLWERRGLDLLDVDFLYPDGLFKETVK